MDICRIRIERYGCWDNLEVPVLPQALTVIHLKDAGRPRDFRRFLTGMLFHGENGLRNIAGEIEFTQGSRALTLVRSGTGDGGWDTTGIVEDGQRLRNVDQVMEEIRAGVDPAVLRYFWLGSDEPSMGTWNWLHQNLAVAGWLLPDRYQEPDAVLSSLSRMDVSPHGRIIHELAMERECLLAKLAEDRHSLEGPTQTDTPSMAQAALLVDYQDSLRDAQRRLEPWAVAAELAAMWQEIQTLSAQQRETKDARLLADWLHEYRDLKRERSRYETLLAQVAAKPLSQRSKTAELEFEIRRLLDRRDWVRKAARSKTAAHAPPPPKHARETQPLVEAYETLAAAKNQCEQSLGKLNAWQAKPSGLSEKLDTLRGYSEFSPDDPLANESNERQLAELKRRRLWVREEQACLFRRQQSVGTMTIVTGLLFCLSIAAVFGVLLVSTPTYEWLLTALGLCGMVAAGAMRLAYDQRLGRLLARSAARLARIDEEINWLSHDRSLPADTTDQEFRRVQAELQREVALAQMRRTEAEARLRDVQLAIGVPVSLTLPQALRVVRERSRATTRLARGDHPTDASEKLKRWVKQAHRAIARVDRACVPSLDPDPLLAQLEATLRKLRDRGRAEKSSSDAQRKQLRQELRRIERRQREILELAAVPDEMGVERQLKEAERNSVSKQRLDALRREVQVRLTCHEEGDEIRDHLERYTATEISDELSRVQQIISKLQRQLAEAQQEKTSTPVKTTRAADRRVDEGKLRLGVIEARLRQAVQAAQQGLLLQRIAGRLLSKPTRTETPFLSLLTRWSNIRRDEENFVLSNSHEQALIDAGCPDVEGAWLALRLRAAEKLRHTGRSLPLVLDDRDLQHVRTNDAFLRVLRDVAHDGQQILLLTARSPWVRELAESGEAVVRVGLRQEATRSATRSATLDRAAG